MNPDRTPDHQDHQDHQDQSRHPDIRENAPGRIPESLINAAIDGEINEDIQREIAHALRYDPVRAQEVRDTKDAINALQMPIATPDFSARVLDRADRHRRFIPAVWRKHVRAGRMGIAAMLLLSLMTIAGLQRLYPRLTTLASHPTPVLDVEQAVSHDATVFSQNIKDEIGTMRQSVASLLPNRMPNRFPSRSRAITNASSNTLVAPGQMNFEFGSSQSELSQVQLASFVSNAQDARLFDGLSTSAVGHQIAVIYMINAQQNDRSQDRLPTAHARLFVQSPVGSISSSGASCSSWAIVTHTSTTESTGSSGTDQSDTIRVNIAALP